MSDTVITAIIESCDHVSEDVCRLTIRLKDAPQVHQAGQYLMVKINGDWSAFSIANAPNEHVDLVELHVGIGNSTSAMTWQVGQKLDVQYPMGDCVYLSGGAPLLLVAGGTGFSQIKAFVEACISENRDAKVIWLGKDTSDFYLRKWLGEISEAHDCISATTLVLDHRDMSTEAYQKAFINHVKAFQLDPKDTSAYLAGAPPMVKCLANALELDGFSRQSLKSDIFDLGL